MSIRIAHAVASPPRVYARRRALVCLQNTPDSPKIMQFNEDDDVFWPRVLRLNQLNRQHPFRTNSPRMFPQENENAVTRRDKFSASFRAFSRVVGNIRTFEWWNFVSNWERFWIFWEFRVQILEYLNSHPCVFSDIRLSEFRNVRVH